MKNLEFTNIFIIDSIEYFHSEVESIYSKTNDLVLTFDFALYKSIESFGGKVEYIDHIIDSSILEKYNYEIYEFFRNWHYDKNTQDIFRYKDIDFGFSLRLEFWNDYTSYIRLLLSIRELTTYKYNHLIYIGEDELISNILHTLSIEYKNFIVSKDSAQVSYFFPITKWLNSKIKPSGMRKLLYSIRAKVTYVYGRVMPYIDRILYKKVEHTIFIQDYHPTRRLIQELRKDNKIKILLSNFSRFSNKIDNLKERLIPISGFVKDYFDLEKKYLDELKLRRYHKLVLNDLDISDAIYDLIEEKLYGRIANTLRTLNSCIHYLENNQVDLVVLIANIGHIDTLFDLVCKSKNIPSYMIINGLLLNNHQDESKYATFINSYSQSIKDNYFKGMNNVVTLGDSRMDTYFQITPNKINREIPIITIGTSGFNPVDLNSYVAIEFDFLYDILNALQRLKDEGEKFKIVLKVRPNGYQEQYISFISSYFNTLAVKVITTTPMIDVLKETDFYITLASQTLFEASCLGIPVVYYKKDTEILNEPFNEKSELVTVKTVDDLLIAYKNFKNNSPRYNDFLDKKIMEKYIGYLDGNNFQRNKDFIYKILKNENV